MSAFVIVRRVDARADQRQRHIAARAPERFAIRAIEQINIGLIRNVMFLGKRAQFIVQAKMIRPAAILDAKRRVNSSDACPAPTTAISTVTNSCTLGWNACRRAVTNLLIIGDMEIDGSRGALTCLRQRFDRGDDICYTSLVVEKTRADESIRHFHTRVERNTIADYLIPNARVSLSRL